MRVPTIDKKTKIIKNGVEMIDFAEPTFIPDWDSKFFAVTRRIIVTPEYDMRPDLLSFALYGTDDHVDILLKVNEYSSPLSVRAGDLIVVPAVRPAENFYRVPEIYEDKETSDSKYLDSNKKSKQDENRLAALAQISKSTKNGSSENRRPNELKAGESNIISNNGGISI